MPIDFTPSSNRTSFHTYEPLVSRSTEKNISSETKIISPRLLNVRLTAQELAYLYFQKCKVKGEVTESTLTGHRFSVELKDSQLAVLSRLTAKALKADFESLMRFLEEERRVGELRVHWSKLKENFQALYLSLVHADEREKMEWRREAKF